VEKHLNITFTKKTKPGCKTSVSARTYEHILLASSPRSHGLVSASHRKSSSSLLYYKDIQKCTYVVQSSPVIERFTKDLEKDVLLEKLFIDINNFQCSFITFGIECSTESLVYNLSSLETFQLWRLLVHSSAATEDRSAASVDGEEGEGEGGARTLLIKAASLASSASETGREARGEQDGGRRGRHQIHGGRADPLGGAGVGPGRRFGAHFPLQPRLGPREGTQLAAAPSRAQGGFGRGRHRRCQGKLIRGFFFSFFLCNLLTLFFNGPFHSLLHQKTEKLTIAQNCRVRIYVLYLKVHF